MFNQEFKNFGLLIPRLFVGITLAFAHGLGKLPPSAQFIEGVRHIGFPLPVVFAWAAALSEFAGGLLLAMGLFVRPASGLIGFTMFVAAFLVHRADPFRVREMALLYLAFAVLFFFVGGGKWSFDAIIEKKMRDASS